jgi:SAM-dependent methyltransferase
MRGFLAKGEGGANVLISPMLDDLQCWILKGAFPRGAHARSDAARNGRPRVHLLFGKDFSRWIKGKTVIDFGCGEGLEAIEIAAMGAKRVIGIDIQEHRLEIARKNAERAGVQNCTFALNTTEKADVLVSIDTFEHFERPATVLAAIEKMLAPNAEVMVSFGPTWYHPHGGHLFSVFPWAHLVFSESALIQWRSEFKTDGATRFSEVAGGLNRMTIRRFRRIVAASPLRIIEFHSVPIRRVTWLHNRVTREFTTSIVQCRLGRRAA